MASHKSVTTTVIRNEIDQVATDSKFMLSMTDQDGDGLLSMEEAREKVKSFYFFLVVELLTRKELTNENIIQ